MEKEGRCSLKRMAPLSDSTQEPGEMSETWISVEVWSSSLQWILYTPLHEDRTLKSFQPCDFAVLEPPNLKNLGSACIFFKGERQRSTFTETAREVGYYLSQKIFDLMKQKCYFVHFVFTDFILLIIPMVERFLLSTMRDRQKSSYHVDKSR